MNLGLENKRVLITGGTSGIGLALVKGFLNEGAVVAIMARDSERLNKITKDLTKAHGPDRVMPINGDCSENKPWEEAVDYLGSCWNGLDLVVANVGDGRSVSDPLPDQDRFDQTWKVNFTTAHLTAHFTIPLLKTYSGCLLFISSIAGLEYLGAPTDYSVAKSAIVALSKQLSRKLAPAVRVNCIAPGNIYFEGGSWDEKIKADPQGIEKLVRSTVPMSRFGTPEEIADLALFLCSDRARFITGSCVVADGGQTVGYF